MPRSMGGPATALGTAALMWAAAPPAAAQVRPADVLELAASPADHRIAYGGAPQQFGELRLPDGDGPHPVAIVLHGGCWPGTFLDVAAGVDHLRALAEGYDLDLGRVLFIGHSAGGHLALWAAGRQRIPPGSPLHATDRPATSA